MSILSPLAFTQLSPSRPTFAVVAVDAVLPESVLTVEVLPDADVAEFDAEAVLLDVPELHPDIATHIRMDIASIKDKNFIPFFIFVPP
jgi:hypothetical protein